MSDPRSHQPLYDSNVVRCTGLSIQLYAVSGHIGSLPSFPRNGSIAQNFILMPSWRGYMRAMEWRDLTTLVFRLSNLRHTFKDFNPCQQKSVTTERLRCRLNIKKCLRDSCSHLCIYFSYYLNCLNFPHSSWYCFVMMMIMVMMAVVMMVVVVVVIAAALGVWWVVLVNMMMTTMMIIVQRLVDEG